MRVPAVRHVVNLVSVAGTVAFAPAGAYAAAKHAQLAFSRSTAAVLRGTGIRVHTVLPGFVETEGFPQQTCSRAGSCGGFVIGRSTWRRRSRRRSRRAEAASSRSRGSLPADHDRAVGSCRASSRASSELRLPQGRLRRTARVSAWRREVCQMCAQSTVKGSDPGRVRYGRWRCAESAPVVHSGARGGGSRAVSLAYAPRASDIAARRVLPRLLTGRRRLRDLPGQRRPALRFSSSSSSARSVTGGRCTRSAS